MTDVYRTAARGCPKCAGVSLREFHGRWVCDECQGLLIGFEDFASACADLTGEVTTLSYREDAPVATPCPSCTKPMVECTVLLVDRERTSELRDRFLRCEQHGLWCGPGVLAGTFAQITRKLLRPSHPVGASGVGPDGLMRTGAVSLENLVYRRRPRGRGPAITPINVYADRDLACPVCATVLQFMGDRWSCTGCAGIFVETAALVAMVQHIKQAYWEPPPLTGEPGSRPCPVCTDAMIVERFHSTTIERCQSHGAWFDANELAEALLEATEPPKTTGGWLRRLFGRQQP